MKRASRAIVLFLCAMFVFCSTVMAHDYTEEQVQAAKNWLSSHGYPPTEAGANQAYADFENGMWHDDPMVMQYLGITPAPTTAPTTVPDPSATPGISDTPSDANDNTNVVTEPNGSVSNSTGETTQSYNPSETNSDKDVVETTAEATETSETPSKEAEEVRKSNEESRKRETRSKILAFVIIGVAAIVVLIGGFLFFKKK